MLQSVAKKALRNERVNICLTRSTGSDIAVWSHRKTQRAFFGGLMVCGSVWACPLCASKIAERRKLELQIAFYKHKATGGKIAMLTLTFSHKLYDDLGVLLHHFKLANKKFFESRVFRNVREEMNVIGRIRVLEVTYGSNGYHPHVHIALFYFNDVFLEAIESDLLNKWIDVCEKVGLQTSWEHGLRLEHGEDAANYLSKYDTWSLEQELTKAHIKKAKKDSMTPFDFLRAYVKTEDKKYLTLFADYHKHFKGKKQLQWSPGLKKLFGITEMSDEEIEKKKMESADILGMLNYLEWKQIIKANARANFLDNIELYGLEEALKLISDKDQ